jgi:hypothetical protein
MKRFGKAHRIISKHFSVFFLHKDIYLLECNCVWSVKSQPVFRGTRRIHLHDRRISQARNQHWTGKRQIFKGLQGVISLKKELFVTTAVRISNTFSTYSPHFSNIGGRSRNIHCHDFSDYRRGLDRYSDLMNSLQLVTASKDYALTVLHTSQITTRHTSSSQLVTVFNGCCLVVASNDGRSPSSAFPNCSPPQLPISHKNSSQQLKLRRLSI